MATLEELDVQVGDFVKPYQLKLGFKVMGFGSDWRGEKTVLIDTGYLEGYFLYNGTDLWELVSRANTHIVGQ